MRKSVIIVLSGIMLGAPLAFAQEQEQVAPAAPAAAPAAPAAPAAAKAAGKAAPAAAQPKQAESSRVEFNPKTQRDPMLSPDDIALMESRRRAAEAAREAERLRLLEEERRRAEEAERLRQLELLRMKDPAREVRNKIRIGGIIDKEVFIGDKIYTVGNSVYGARIVEVRPEEVVFSYKGHTFIKRIPL